VTLGLLATLVVSGANSPWTPAALAASCEVPPAPGSLPAAATPGATPIAVSSVMQVEGQASGRATPGALPAAGSATPVSTTAESDTAALRNELTAVSEAIAACLSEGNAKTVTKLADERYLGQLFGSSVPLSSEEYIAIAKELTPIPTRIIAVDAITEPAADRATATVTQVVGNQLLQAEWTFERNADNSSAWKLRSERQLPVDAPRDAAAIGVEIGDTAFTLNRESSDSRDIVLQGKNASAEDHEMLVLKLENGFTTDDLLRATGPNLPKEAVYIGELPIRGGREADLVLVDLDPGAYTIVCLFPNADGVPYLADGMEATFTIT
jgi:hypothetical protein